MNINQGRTLKLVATLGMLALLSPAQALDTAKWEKCYQNFGQVETTTEGNKKTSQYKSPEEVAQVCNQKITAEAKKQKDVQAVMDLAGVVGRQSNWPSALGILNTAAKLDKSKKVCSDKKLMTALEDGLARPADDSIAKDGSALLGTCWDAAHDAILALLKTDQNSYTNGNICQFLKAKNAIPADKAEICNKSTI